MNKTVQTGANIQLGGLNEGFAMTAYHVEIAEEVNNEPINAAIWGIIKQTIKVIMCFSFIIF